MKLRMYMDFWPTTSQEGKIHTATSAPCMKMLGTVRVAFDVHIPDDILHKPDRMANEVSKAVEVDDVISNED